MDQESRIRSIELEMAQHETQCEERWKQLLIVYRTLKTALLVLKIELWWQEEVL